MEIGGSGVGVAVGLATILSVNMARAQTKWMVCP
jgi:hypothetical protein